MAEQNISDWIVKNHRHYIIANKPSGMPVQAGADGSQGIDQLLSAYTKCNLHVVNRIDQPVSGLVLLAKNGVVAGQLAQALAAKKTVKTYLAIVDKSDAPLQGRLHHHLRKTNNKSLLCEPNHPRAKEAILYYETVQELDRYRIVKVHTETGRFHQIRAQLSAAGMPIKGDVKYGSRRGNKDRSIYLHAYELAYYDPISSEQVVHQAPLPDDPLWALYKGGIATDE